MGGESVRSERWESGCGERMEIEWVWGRVRVSGESGRERGEGEFGRVCEE